MAQSAYREVVVCLEQALVALAHLSESRARALEQAIDLRFDLRNALLPLGEQARIFDYLREAEALAQVLDRQRLGQVSVYMTEYFRMMSDLDHAVQSGQRALALATAQRGCGLQVRRIFMSALTMIWVTTAGR